jgi:hypothetical protein
MFKVQELNDYGTYVVMTFTDNEDAYGALMLLDENQLYVEFMEFDGEELKVITEDESPEEFKRLEEKYLDDIIEAID